MKLSPIDVREANGINEPSSHSHASQTAGNGTSKRGGHADENLIVMLASRYRLPAVFVFRYSLRPGLISYGPNLLDQYRAGPGYVDRILEGRTADLPVQARTKYETVINLKTAGVWPHRAAMVLVRADGVIE